MKDRFKDRLARAIAWMLPRRVVKWAGYRIGASATTGRYTGQVVPDLRFMDAMQRWETP